MSRTYEALKRAERRSHGRPGRPPNGGAGPEIVTELDHGIRLQYERIQVWMATCTPSATPVRTLMIAACQSGNGATTTATRLALTLATRPATKVLLVDANLRTPNLHRVFGAENQGGFNDLLGHLQDSSNGSGDYLQATARGNLFVLTTGRIAHSPLETFSPAAVTALLEQLTARFDVVLFDVPPLLDYPDAYALAPAFDATLLVVEAERTLVDDARRVVQELQRLSGRPVGVVLNRERDYTPALLRRLSRAR